MYSPGRPQKVSERSEPTGRRRLVWAAAGLLLVIGWYAWPDSQMTKVRQMQQELFGMSGADLPPEARKPKLEALRAEQEKLSGAQRDVLRKEMGRQFQQKMNAGAVRYLVMTPAQRRKVIDDKIAREQARAKKPQPAGKVTAGKSGGGPGGNTKNGGEATRAASTPEQRDAKRREALIHTWPAARAGMDQMRLDMTARRAQLGLPPSRGFGFGTR